MKKIIFSFCLALLQVCAFAQTPFTAPWGFNYSAPTGAPSALGTRVRFDITTGRIYTWSPDALNWQLQGYTIDQISGTSAPAYAPVRGQSWFAINGDTLPRLYQYTGTGTIWKCLNCSDGKTYTAGTGITLSGPNSTVINNAGDLSATNELNTGFDISGGNLRIIDAGTTRTVAVTSIAPDQSVTNEIQTIDTFLVSGSNLLLSLTQDNQPAKTITLPASGITALTGDVTASGPGSAVATIAAGAVTAGKLASMGASSGQVLGWNGSVWGPTAAGSGWGLTGNAATAGSSFLGTTNNTSLRFRTNNVQRLMLDSLGNVGIGTTSPSERLKVVGGNIEVDAARRYRWSDGSFLEGGGTSSLMTIRSLGNFLMQGSNLYLATTAGTPAAKLHVVGAGATSATWGLQVHNSTGTNNAFIVRDDGNVGVGTASPSSKIEMSSASNQAVNNLGGLMLSTPTDATVGLQQWSPPLVLRGRGWKTDATAGSRTVDIALVAIPEQGTDLPTGGLSVRANYGNFGWNTEIIRFTPGYTQFGNSLNLRTINAAGAISTSGERYEWRAGLISTIDAYAWSFLNGNGSRSAVSGTNGFINFQESFAPTSGTGTYQFVRLRPIINQTGGANGATYGLFIDPLLTSAFDYRSIQMTNSSGWALHSSGTAPSYLAGDVRIGTTTAIASAALDVTSTTKGFLPPRMTATQASAIASPAEGLMVYVTNTNGTFTSKGWWGYNGAAWEKLNN